MCIMSRPGRCGEKHRRGREVLARRARDLARGRHHVPGRRHSGNRCQRTVQQPHGGVRPGDGGSAAAPLDRSRSASSRSVRSPSTLPPRSSSCGSSGATSSRFHPHWHLLAEDQGNRPKAIELDIKRIYVLLYSWIKGEDAEDALRAGDLTADECRKLTLLAIQDLRSKGFRVLDNKPKHFILRKRPPRPAR